MLETGGSSRWKTATLCLSGLCETVYPFVAWLVLQAGRDVRRDAVDQLVNHPNQVVEALCVAICLSAFILADIWLTNDLQVRVAEVASAVLVPAASCGLTYSARQLVSKSTFALRETHAARQRKSEASDVNQRQVLVSSQTARPPPSVALHSTISQPTGEPRRLQWELFNMTPTWADLIVGLPIGAIALSRLYGSHQYQAWTLKKQSPPPSRSHPDCTKLVNAACQNKPIRGPDASLEVTRWSRNCPHIDLDILETVVPFCQAIVSSAATSPSAWDISMTEIFCYVLMGATYLALSWPTFRTVNLHRSKLALVSSILGAGSLVATGLGDYQQISRYRNTLLRHPDLIKGLQLVVMWLVVISMVIPGCAVMTHLGFIWTGKLTSGFRERLAARNRNRK